MSKAKIRYRNLNDTKQIKKEEISSPSDARQKQFGTTIFYNFEKIFQEDQTIFFLNNILMGVQFFKNYERDVEILRQNWFKETALDNHHKKCFYADSLFTLVGKNVKFQPRHGTKKNSKECLHPVRIFISSDNLEAAYDPAALGKKKLDVMPHYQFTVKPCDNNKKEKLGYVSLIELKTLDSPTDTNEVKFSVDQKNTKIENFYGFQNKELNSVAVEKTGFLNCSTEARISYAGFYSYEKSEARLRPKPIYKHRMNSFPQTSHRIPKRCFQMIDKRKNFNSRRQSFIYKSPMRDHFRTRNILNSAAFKGHFCDVLIEKLADPLGLDNDSLSEAVVHEEFVCINQNEHKICITPIVKIKDWQQYLEINKKPQSNKKMRRLEWPTDQMRKVIQVLPCNLVPKGYSEHLEENLDYEKEWEIVFSKAEEYLLMHMMHAHIRCYFFVLAIYKSFIEFETNSASFGLKHLKHLLFWRVQKDFLGWPEDRPGETLLNFLKVLYKKLQHKSLPDFFITSRNLFSTSQPMDLHKAQAIIKMILNNPVPYIMKAVRNLNLKPDFYVEFDILKLNSILREFDKPEVKIKKFNELKKHKDRRAVTFEADEKLRKNIIKPIGLEGKTEEKRRRRNGETEEQRRISQLSVDSINTDEILRLDLISSFQHCQILQMFISHFVEMGMKSTQYEALDQALMYLFQVKILVKLLTDQKLEPGQLQEFNDKMNKLSQETEKLKITLKCNSQDKSTKELNATKKLFSQEVVLTAEEKPKTSSIEDKAFSTENTSVKEENKIEEPIRIKTVTVQSEDENVNDENSNEDEKFETKL